MAQEKVADLLHTFTVSAIISIVATGLLLTEPTQHAALTLLIWMFALSSYEHLPINDQLSSDGKGASEHTWNLGIKFQNQVHWFGNSKIKFQEPQSFLRSLFHNMEFATTLITARNDATYM